MFVKGFTAEDAEVAEKLQGSNFVNSRKQSSTPNPYESPRSVTESEPHLTRSMSFLRGSVYALPASLLGFAIPYVALAALAAVRAQFFQLSLFDRDAYLRALPIYALAPAIACALVFVLAAFLNFTPTQKIGLVRALMLAGSSVLFGLIVMGVATELFGLGRRTYTSDPFLALRCCIGIFASIGCTVVILKRTIRKQQAAQTAA